ncbi:Uncharacterised protein [Klebsiella quasipneumoniae]|nr:Uncharacterised protein [Klebsiella quasipneumoniae]
MLQSIHHLVRVPLHHFFAFFKILRMIISASYTVFINMC